MYSTTKDSKKFSNQNTPFKNLCKDSLQITTNPFNNNLNSNANSQNDILNTYQDTKQKGNTVENNLLSDAE